jgi:hypothetical protein
MIRRGSTVRSPSEGFSILPAQSSLSFSALTPFGCFGVHRASTRVSRVELERVQRIEQLDRLLTPLGGEVSLVAVDHRQAGGHVGR